MSGNSSSSNNKSVFAGQKTKPIKSGTYAMSTSASGSKKPSNSATSAPSGSCGGKSISEGKKWVNWNAVSCI